MARNIVPCQAWVDHKKNARWTKEELCNGLAEFNILLDQEFTGNIRDKHWVILPSNERKFTDLRSILSGTSAGKYACWTESTIAKRLNELGITLDQEYTGSTSDRHWVVFGNGIRNFVVLNGVLNGVTTGKVKNPRYNHTTESINSTLSQYGAVLTEPFKGHTHNKHNILFGCGHQHETMLCNVLQGSGCPICCRTGFNPSKPAYLYFIQIEFQGSTLYKVGITNLSVNERYAGQGVKPVTLALFHHKSGFIVHKTEREILKEFKSCLYNGESPFKTTGTTEVFTTNLLEEPNFYSIVNKYALEKAYYPPIAN